MVLVSGWLTPSRASELVLLFTNDVHGRLEPRSRLGGAQVGGAPALYSLVAEERAKLRDDQDLVLVDSGDFLLGSLRDLHHRGAPSIRMMNLLGYQAAALGNHEFDLGWGTLRLRAREAEFPFLSANLSRPGLPGFPRTIRPSVLKTLPRSGRRLGLVGLTAEGDLTVHPRSRNPGLQLGSPQEALQRELDRLQGQGAELVVVLSHLGVDADRELVRNSGDRALVVIGGHYPATRVDLHLRQTRLLQALPEGAEVGRLTIPWGATGPEMERSQVTWLPWASRPTGATPVDEILRDFPEPDHSLAENPTRWSFRQTCAWVLEAMRSRSRVLGQEPDLVLINRGALRASLPRGQVSPRSLFRIAPFENHLVFLELPAKRLEKLLEGLEAEGDGGRLLWIGEIPERPRRGRVRVLVNDFLAAGGDGFDLFPEGKNQEVLPDTVQDCLRLALAEDGQALAPPPALPDWMLRRKPSTP